LSLYLLYHRSICHIRRKVIGRKSVKSAFKIRWQLRLILCLAFLAGCSQPLPPVTPASTATSNGLASTPVQPSPTPALSLTPLQVSLLYPTSDIKIQMGQPTKLIVRVIHVDGSPAAQAQVTAAIDDSAGNSEGTIPLTVGPDGAFRSQSWTIPHHSQPGVWQIAVQAHLPTAQGQALGTFQVQPSTSERLQAAYGFWLDAPALRGIVSSVFAEKGDAQDGLVLWGGAIPGQHVFPENWVQIQWRTGDFHLDSPQAVRQFMDTQLGELSSYSIRAIGPIQQVKFKHWDAWKVDGRAEFWQMNQQWMIFYAPEVNKTYSLGTLVVHPPTGIDPHAALRDSFEVYPDLHANGVAPEPLPHLLPIPQLITPTLGAHFVGPQQSIVLKWQPLKELAQDEYYRVDIQFNYDESSPLYRYATRQTQFTVPENLYSQPNCRIFNWQVTLMRKTGEDQNGQPVGEPLSYPSLYWYFEWYYPSGQAEPFTVLCPNAQT
jgi:hypothetical protein